MGQAITFFNCVPFQNLLKDLLPVSEFFPLRAVPYGMETHFLPHKLTFLKRYYSYYARA